MTATESPCAWLDFPVLVAVSDPSGVTVNRHIPFMCAVFLLFVKYKP